MSALGEIYIKKETLETLLKVVTKKADKGVSITISISDETNGYGQNISSYVSQSKEDRESQKPKYYAGNGKVFWTDGKIVTAEKKDKPRASSKPDPEDEGDDLPF